VRATFLFTRLAGCKQLLNANAAGAYTKVRLSKDSEPSLSSAGVESPAGPASKDELPKSNSSTSPEKVEMDTNEKQNIAKAAHDFTCIQNVMFIFSNV
jgi:hypothetical protein